MSLTFLQEEALSSLNTVLIIGITQIFNRTFLENNMMLHYIVFLYD